jgi:hypothetical protein
MAFQAPTSTDFARFILVYKLIVEKISTCMHAGNIDKFFINNTQTLYFLQKC